MRHLCTLLLFSLATVLMAQDSGISYVRAKVQVPEGDATILHSAGLDLEHGIYIPGRFYIGDLASWELQRIEALGLEVQILIPDVMTYYQQQRQRRQLACQAYDYDYVVPQNFEYGSMGGYLTYQEMIDVLDIMHFLYPELISAREQAGTDLTHEGRALHWVRISDNATEDENEPEILYTGLHHAREPMSMMQMIYFMWYLLEQYETDSEIKYLLNNTEMYFVPCVNPDGYIYNHTIAPDGGGLWRKNMRDNNGDEIFNESEDGVDLNRNYAFQWGLDDEGSSSHPGSNVYRGPEPFSEPETRALRDFIMERDFLFALNYHAYGNFLLIPWGFNGVDNPDSVAFRNYGELMSIDNGFEIGTTTETLGYLTNGVASDWMYAAHDIISMTPELGDTDVGFWPAQTDIIPLAQAALKKNLYLAHLTHEFALATEINSDYLTARDGELEITVKRYGMEPGSMALTVESLSPELQIQGVLQEVGFELFEREFYAYQYSLGPEAISGNAYSFVVKIDNGFFEVRDTVTKVYSGVETAFADEGEAMDQWAGNAESLWGITEEVAFSGPTSLTDSPYEDYTKSKVNIITLNEPVSLRDAISAELSFKARWEIEEIIDYALVQVSTDGENFVNLCGQYSKPGSIFQLTGEPVYHGTQTEWVQETIDLSAYAGEDIYIRFTMVSDGFFEMDGIYLDDIEIRAYLQETTETRTIAEDQFTFSQYPNPASAQFRIEADLTDSEFKEGRLILRDPLGRVIESRLVQAAADINELFDIRTLPAGIYTASLEIDGLAVKSQRIIIH